LLAVHPTQTPSAVIIPLNTENFFARCQRERVRVSKTNFCFQSPLSLLQYHVLKGMQPTRKLLDQKKKEGARQTAN
jgi:hypothetical protein